MLKIPGTDHVQTSKLQVMQHKKDQLLRKISQLKYHMEVYEKKIEALKKEIFSSQSSKLIYPSEELTIALSKLNLKGVEIEKIKK
jgi:hypothetical protein